MPSNLHYKLKNTKATLKHRPKKKNKEIAPEQPVILEEEVEEVEEIATVGLFEISSRLFLSTVIVAIAIFTAFFPITAPFAIFIIPVALSLAAAITKKPLQNYMKEHPASVISKIFNLATGARNKVKQVSYKLTKEEYAIEGIGISAISAAVPSVGVKNAAAGISASRIINGEGSSFERSAMMQHLHKHQIYKNSPVADSPFVSKVGDTVIKKAMTSQKKAPTTTKKTPSEKDNTSAKEVKETLTKHQTEQTKTSDNKTDLKKAKATLAKHGAKGLKVIPKHQLEQINKLTTPRTSKESPGRAVKK